MSEVDLIDWQCRDTKSPPLPNPPRSTFMAAITSSSLPPPATDPLSSVQPLPVTVLANQVIEDRRCRPCGSTCGARFDRSCTREDNDLEWMPCPPYQLQHLDGSNVSTHPHVPPIIWRLPRYRLSLSLPDVWLGRNELRLLVYTALPSWRVSIMIVLP